MLAEGSSLKKEAVVSCRQPKLVASGLWARWVDPVGQGEVPEAFAIAHCSHYSDLQLFQNPS